MLDISADPVTSVSDSLLVTYDVVGRSLAGIIIDYGDSEIDSISFLGAQSAGGHVVHRYASPGDYLVRGTVEDVLEGSVSDEVAVTITP